MTDTLTPERRSWNMSRIRGSDTGPEKIVRSALHRMGLRFRLHRKDLPGRPDIVLPGLHTVVFVHGCYWHRHPGCRLAYNPKTRVEFWQAKFQDNVERDSRQQAELEAAGWRVVIVWECSTGDPEQLASELQGLVR